MELYRQRHGGSHQSFVEHVFQCYARARSLGDPAPDHPTPAPIATGAQAVSKAGDAVVYQTVHNHGDIDILSNFSVSVLNGWRVAIRFVLPNGGTLEDLNRAVALVGVGFGLCLLYISLLSAFG